MRSHHLYVQARVGLGLAALIAAGGICGEQAMAQGGAHIVVMDDGQGPMVSHFSLPDMGELRQPDFVRKDLPIFTEKLVLSEAQTAAIERQIETYLAAFEQLKKDMLNFPGMPQMVMPFAMHGEEGEFGEDGPMGAMLFGPGGEGEEMGAWAIAAHGEDHEGMPEDMTFSIGVQVEVPDGEEGGGVPAEPGVEVSFESSDELPEEVRKELEEHARELAEKIMKQIEEQQAAGDAQGAAPVLPGMTDIEQMQQRQEEMKAGVKKFRQAKSQLRQEFVVEAQTTLSDPQLERWPSLERALLREKSLPKGRLSGERTNLFKVVKGLDLPAEQQGSLSPTLDAYDIEMDVALRHRNDIVDDATAKIDEGMEKADYDRVMAAMDRAAAARVAVRSVNERFTDVLAELLAEPTASAFRQAVLKASYPQVYRTTLAEKTLDAAVKLEGLSDDSRTQLAGLRAAYRIERDDVDERLRQTINRYQPTESRRTIEHMKDVTAGAEPGAIHWGDENDPVRELMDRRKELDERYIKSVKDFLTPEQIEQLPKPPVRRMGKPIIIRRGPGE